MPFGGPGKFMAQRMPAMSDLVYVVVEWEGEVPVLIDIYVAREVAEADATEYQRQNGGQIAVVPWPVKEERQ